MAEVAPLLPRSVPVEVGPTSIDASMGIGDVAFAVMRAHFATMLRREPGVRYGNDAEDLHQMRVAIRRIRAAMVVFEEALPVRAQHLRKELGWLGSLLGAVRDLDVQLERIAAWSAAAEPPEREALDVVAAVLNERRVKARTRLISGLDSRRLVRMTTSIERFLVRGPVKRSPAAHVPVLQAAPEVLAQRYRKMVAIGDDIEESSPPQVLHGLRIRAKRLRYAVEFLEPIYAKPARAYAKRLIAVQDILGRHQDDVVAIATLRDIALDPPRKIGSPIVFGLGMLAERYRADAMFARGRFPKRYRAATGDRWRKLRRAMQEQRPMPVEPVAPTADPDRVSESEPMRIVRGI